jgi:hypothetical protein
MRDAALDKLALLFLALLDAHAKFSLVRRIST